MSSHTFKAEPNPSFSLPQSSHEVQFYESDSALIEALGHHVGGALAGGDSAIVLATSQHRSALSRALRLRNVDAGAATKSGRYIELDASEVLHRLLVNENIDAQKFNAIVGELVAQAENHKAAGRRLVIYGELVALLWAEGNHDATLRLEELWNDLAQRHSFALLCGYPLDAFARMGHRQHFFSICGEHTRINPAESYRSEGSENEQRRSAYGMQHKRRMLETEIRLSRERILLLQDLTKSGTWELDVVNDIFALSSAAARLLGFQNSGRMGLGQLLNLMYYSGDRAAMISLLEESQRRRRELKGTFRINREGETRMIEMRGKTFYNGGHPLMLGVMLDVTPHQDQASDSGSQSAPEPQQTHQAA